MNRKKGKNKNVLIATPDHIGKKMAGIGLRHWEIAHSLAKHFNVVLATPYETSIESDSIQIRQLDIMHKRSLTDMIRWSDVVVSLSHMADSLSGYVEKNKKPFVVDLVCPYHFEELEFGKMQFGREKNLYRTRYVQILESLRNQMQKGDFFICAGEKQRDYWLGMLSAEGRLSQRMYEDDKSFRNLIDVVPFGISETPPVHRRQMIKGVWKDITKNDFVVLWGGGIWNWFDPLTLIKAMALLGKKQKNIKLVFICSQHPNKDNPSHRMTEKALKLSKTLQLYDKNVYFYSDWVPYQERENYLLESDIGVISHFNHIENRFSFRTRIMDCFWAGLPVVTTKGDCMSDTVAQNSLGLVVDYEDVNGWAEAILRLYKNKELRRKFSRNIKRFSKEYTWDNVCKPLTGFCENASRIKKTDRKRLYRKVPLSMEEFLKKENAKRILLLRSSSFPYFSDSMNFIKKSFKDAKVDLIVQKDTETLLKKRYPGNNIFVYPYRFFDRKMLKNGFLKDLKKKKYDLVIYTTNSFEDNEYENVRNFSLEFPSKFYLYINRKNHFYKTDHNMI